ncbi:hypothetical protein YC2023_114967 [Brassica napus]
MKEAARAAEAKIEETAQEIRSSRRTIEEGLERVNSEKMKAEEEETQWQWSEWRRRSSSSYNYKGKYKNRRDGSDGTHNSNSVATSEETDDMSEDDEKEVDGKAAIVSEDS